MNTLWVGLGASFGAMARFGINRFFEKKPQAFPHATLLINLTGSFLLGVFSGWQLDQRMYLFLGTGMMGGYTTFSTFNFEVFMLKDRRICVYYLLGTYFGGLLLSFCGVLLGFFLKSFL